MCVSCKVSLTKTTNMIVSIHPNLRCWPDIKRHATTRAVLHHMAQSERGTPSAFWSIYYQLLVINDWHLSVSSTTADCSPQVAEYCKWAYRKTNTFCQFLSLPLFLHSSPFFLPLSVSLFVSQKLNAFLLSLNVKPAYRFSALPELSSEGQPYPVTYSRPHTISLPWQPWLISPTTLQGQLLKKGNL